VIAVAIVGLGRVGSRCHADGGPPRSHVASVLATPGLALVAAIDPSTEAREMFRKQWPAANATRVLGSLDELDGGEIDVIALCTPTAGRPSLVATALDKQPRLLVVEKPIAASLAEARAIARAADRHGVPMRVNFHRRFDPRHQALRQLLPGTPRQVVMRYGKGVFNYGSHLVDLLIDWFGPVQKVQALSSTGSDGDPALTFRVWMQRGFDAILIGMRDLSYDQFEVDLFFEGLRIEIANGGTEMRQYAVTADRFYKGYAQLGPASAFGADGPVGGLAEFYQAVRNHQTDLAELGGCDAQQAIAGLEVLEAARESATRGGHVIVMPGIQAASAH
jgi:predicted dehydrogenase